MRVRQNRVEFCFLFETVIFLRQANVLGFLQSGGWLFDINLSLSFDLIVISADNKLYTAAEDYM